MRAAILLIFILGTLAAGSPREDPIEINNEAVKLLGEGNYDTAIRKLVTALNLDPDSDTIRKNLAAAHAQRGFHRGSRGNFAAAIEDMRVAKKKAPKDPRYAYYLAAYLYRTGELLQAEMIVEGAQKLPPAEDMTPKLMRLKGNVLYMQDRLTDALKVFEMTEGKDPGGESKRMASKIKRELAVQKEYQQEVTTYFKLLYDSTLLKYQPGGTFIHMLERERSKVCSDLNYYPRRRVTVIVYNPGDFKAVTASEGWVGGLFDRKIRIPVSDVSRRPEEIQRVVRHEYTHVIMYELAPSCPGWINEGIACHEQYSGQGGVVPRGGLKRMRALLKEGAKPVPFDQLPDDIINTSDADKVRLFYAQSHSMVEYLVDHYGLSRFRLLLREFNKTGDLDKAFRVAFGRDLAYLEKNWLEALKER